MSNTPEQNQDPLLPATSHYFGSELNGPAPAQPNPHQKEVYPVSVPSTPPSSPEGAIEPGIDRGVPPSSLKEDPLKPIRTLDMRWMAPAESTADLLQSAGTAHAAGNFWVALRGRYVVAQTLEMQGPPEGTELLYHPAFAGTIASLVFAARNVYPEGIEWRAITARQAVHAIEEDMAVLERSRNTRSIHYSTLRESLPPACLHAGVLAALLAVQQERTLKTVPVNQWKFAQYFVDAAWEGSARPRPDYVGWVDQNRINTAPRKAAISGLNGSPMRGLGVVLKGVMLAPLSESPKLSQNSTPELDRRGRWRAKVKTLAGSVAAGAVCVLNTRIGHAFGGRQAALNLYESMEKGDLRVPHLKQLEPQSRQG